MKPNESSTGRAHDKKLRELKTKPANINWYTSIAEERRGTF